VRTLVAHEPPVSELLPDAARYHALNLEIGETYRSQGAPAAMQKFAAGIGFGSDEPGPEDEDTPDADTAMARLIGNLDLFAGRLIPIIGNYQPDIEALRTSPTRILVGVGDESTPEQMTYQASHELARRLDGRPVQFPGGHDGPGSHPDGFADRLRDGLAAQG
jgi:pimeloyl-ACP methyl ester carboxylesterase